MFIAEEGTAAHARVPFVTAVSGQKRQLPPLRGIPGHCTILDADESTRGLGRVEDRKLKKSGLSLAVGELTTAAQGDGKAATLRSEAWGSRSVMEQPVWDVVVVGAGAAGMLAAYRAALRGLKTVLLEKNRKLGVKILISGGTRCNVTHATDARGIVAAFGHQGRFLHSALAGLGPADVVGLLRSAGVETKSEPNGKIFPASDRALDVRDALAGLVRQTACVVRTEAPVRDIEFAQGHFRVQLDGDTIHSRALILTTGGKSYSGCGTTGDGYAWAEKLGHTIVPPVPALAPLVIGDQWPRELTGIALEDVAVTVIRGPKERLEQSRAPFLFTHFGLSGPAPMNVSRAFSRWPTDELKLCCDFAPELHFDQLNQQTTDELQRHRGRAVGSVLWGAFSRRMVEQILRHAQIDPNQKCAEVSHKKMHQAVGLLKRTELRVQGTRGFQKAEVTAGGVRLAEVDSSTMQSKRQPGLYFAGEILDLDGPIGGFNFQAAFSTGWLAGNRVLQNG